jgi:hypothetical protein
LASTTFPEGLKSLPVYNIYGCVSKTMKLSMSVGVFVVVVLVGLKVVVKVRGGGHGGMRGWNGSMKKQTKKNQFSPTYVVFLKSFPPLYLSISQKRSPRIAMF